MYGMRAQITKVTIITFTDTNGIQAYVTTYANTSRSKPRKEQQRRTPGQRLNTIPARTAIDASYV